MRQREILRFCWIWIHDILASNGGNYPHILSLTRLLAPRYFFGFQLLFSTQLIISFHMSDISEAWAGPADSRYHMSCSLIKASVQRACLHSTKTYGTAIFRRTRLITLLKAFSSGRILSITDFIKRLNSFQATWLEKYCILKHPR